MTKNELITSINKKFPDLSESDCLCCVNQIIDFIADHLCHQDKFEIRGFGTFATRLRTKSTGNCTQNGELLPRISTAYPCFKSGKTLKERVNKND